MTTNARERYELLVTNVRYQTGHFGSYYGIKAVTGEGQRVWFRRSFEAQEREALNEGMVVAVVGTPELSPDTQILFLNRARVTIVGRECLHKTLTRHEATRYECPDCGEEFTVTAAEVAA